jgi:hypothetical protein
MPINHGKEKRNMDKQKNNEGGKQTQISISIDREVEGGVYINQTIIGHSQKEFIIDLGLLVPPGNKIKVQSRIITNPIDAKILYLLLKENIEKYEQRFGVIPVQKTSPQKETPGVIH